MNLVQVFTISLAVLVTLTSSNASAQESKSSPPEPETYAELTFHRAPKALDPKARTENWPGFLGPRRNGQSHETHLLATWPEAGPDLVWEMETGLGFGSPAIMGDRLVFAHRVGDQTLVDCVEATTGKRYWRRNFSTVYSGIYIENGGPPSTPIIDGDRVYMHGVEGSLHCYKLTTGQVVWQRDLHKEYKVPHGFFGVVTSPLIVGEKLIINLGSPEGPTVAALDKLTGKLVWGAGKTWGMCCASPVIAKVRGNQRLFVLAGGKSRPAKGGLLVIDPTTGKVTAKVPFRSRTYASVLGASPIVIGNRVFLTAAYSTGTAAFDILENDTLEKAWSTRRFGSEFATPLYVDGKLYAVDGIRDRAGAVICMDPESGKIVSRTQLDWEETIRHAGKVHELSSSIGNGTLFYADGRFYCLGDYGHLLALECTARGARIVARARLFHANQSWTPLVISRGLLYVRQNTPERLGDYPPRLLCYDLRRPAKD